jgi:nucleoside 2-deoxyribosyltransferase
MFRDAQLAFLALPLKDEASVALADAISDTLKQAAFEPFRPDKVPAGQEISEAIQGALRRSAVVIADITGKNPNVLLEVGVAIGLGKPVLLLSQGLLEDVPFDLKGHQVAVYRPDDLLKVSRYVSVWLRDVLARRAAP